MIQPKRVLAIGAHPDDIEYGCLGSLIQWKAKTRAIVCSLGSVGDSSAEPEREDETRSALSEYASVNVAAARGVGDIESLVQWLTDSISWNKPDLIFTHTAHDTHQEHRRVHEATLAAARDHACWILGYASPSVTPDFSPNIFIEIKEQWPQKLAALTAHESQATRSYLTRRALLRAHTTAFATRRGQRRTEAFELYWGVE